MPRSQSKQRNEKEKSQSPGHPYRSKFINLKKLNNKFVIDQQGFQNSFESQYGAGSKYASNLALKENTTSVRDLMRENEARAKSSKANQPTNKSSSMPISFYVNQNSSVVKRLVSEKSQQQLEKLENRRENQRCNDDVQQYLAASETQYESKVASSRTDQKQRL